MSATSSLLASVRATLKASGLDHVGVRPGTTADGVAVFVLESGVPVCRPGRSVQIVPADVPDLADVYAALASALEPQGRAVSLFGASAVVYVQ